MRILRRVSGTAAVLIMLAGCAAPSHTAVAIPKLPTCGATHARLADTRVANETGGRIPGWAPGPMRLCRYRWDNLENKMNLIADITRPLAPAALLRSLSQLRTVYQVYGPNAVFACPMMQGNVDVIIFRAASGPDLTVIEVERGGCGRVNIAYDNFATYISYVASTSLLTQLDAVTATPKAQATTMPSSLSLCTVANKVTTLTVRRGTFTNPTVFSFPSVVSVSNATSVRAVAKTICAIPPDMRTWTIPCPSDQGLTYRLVFTIPKYVITPIILRMGGCGAVEGTGAMGWIHLNANIFRVLGKAMQLHLATIETFVGKIP